MYIINTPLDHPIICKPCERSAGVCHRRDHPRTSKTWWYLAGWDWDSSTWNTWHEGM